MVDIYEIYLHIHNFNKYPTGSMFRLNLNLSTFETITIDSWINAHNRS